MIRSVTALCVVCICTVLLSAMPCHTKEVIRKADCSSAAGTLSEAGCPHTTADLRRESGSQRSWWCGRFPVGICWSVGWSQTQLEPLSQKPTLARSLIGCAPFCQVHFHFHLSTSSKRHHEVFPKAISQLTSTVSFHELELSLSHGRWVSKAVMAILGSLHNLLGPRSALASIA